jgi:ABC-type nitrate/sulfonate/bicarbonate transport system substrate-binding protein
MMYERMKFRIWLSFAMSALFAMNAFAQQKITINYPNRSGSNWPLFLAKDGGYYQKYGLDVTLTFGVMPTGVAMLISGEAQMVNSSLEQLMAAASKDGSLVLVGSSLNRALFELMAAKNIGSIKDLKGKRIAIGQVGDAPYIYLLALLSKSGMSSRDIQWIPVGTDVNGRAAALTSGRVEATLLTAPAYFKLEEQGFKALTNLADHPDIYASTAYLMKKSVIATDPKLPEKLIEAQTEAIKRFYEDKAFAVQSFLNYDKAAQPDEVARVYDLEAKAQAFERIPFVLAPAVKSIVNQQSDPQIAEKMKAYDFHQVIDNSYVERLVKDGFFDKTFGPGIKTEEDRKAKAAFR